MCTPTEYLFIRRESFFIFTNWSKQINNNIFLTNNKSGKNTGILRCFKRQRLFSVSLCEAELFNSGEKSDRYLLGIPRLWVVMEGGTTSFDSCFWDATFMVDGLFPDWLLLWPVPPGFCRILTTNLAWCHVLAESNDFFSTSSTDCGERLCKQILVFLWLFRAMDWDWWSSILHCIALRPDSVLQDIIFLNMITHPTNTASQYLSEICWR